MFGVSFYDIVSHGGPALSVALALAFGMVGQTIAAHARVPGILVLLAFGVLLGPDVANVVRPETLGGGLMDLVGFAVAIILFEGGMTLELRQLKRSGRAIQQLISVGAIVSLVAGATIAGLVMGWGWRLAVLFGTLVVVTGPTVVTPLLRRFRVHKTVSTVLEAEGVLIDAVGAITAAVALELVLSPSGSSAALVLPTILGRLLFGTGVGAAMGGVLGLLLRVRHVIPERLVNTFTFGWALLTFQVANAVVHETGIAAVTAAGMIVGNMHVYGHRSLHSFKEQLTTMLIAMLFVLLVADVRVADVLALGTPGLAVAIATIVTVRPLSVLLGTWGTSLRRNERIFLAWIGPRGIVAAAVASLFGHELSQAGVDGAVELRALVFLVIAVTVVWSAATGSLAAGWLNLRRASDAGWAIFGANPLARRLAQELQHEGSEVVVIDDNTSALSEAERAGLRCLHRDVFEESTFDIAQLDTRLGGIGAMLSEESNYLFGERARLAVRNIRYPLALTSRDRRVTQSMVEDVGGEVLFGAELDLDQWATAISKNQVQTSRWKRGVRQKCTLNSIVDASAIPLVHGQGKKAEPCTNRTGFKKGSVLRVMHLSDDADRVCAFMSSNGWKPTPSGNEG